MAATLARDSSVVRRKEGNAPCLRGMSLTLASETVPSAAQTAAPTAMSRAVAILAVFIMLVRGFGAGSWRRCGAVRVQAGEQAGMQLSVRRQLDLCFPVQRTDGSSWTKLYNGRSRGPNLTAWLRCNFSTRREKKGQLSR